MPPSHLKPFQRSTVTHISPSQTEKYRMTKKFVYLLVLWMLPPAPYSPLWERQKVKHLLGGDGSNTVPGMECLRNHLTTKLCSAVTFPICALSSTVSFL